MATNGHINGDGYTSRNGNGELATREPPHSIEAEEGVIASVVRENERLDKPLASRLEPGHFFRDAHQVIWQAIRALRMRGDPIDVITLSEELERLGASAKVGGFSGIVDLMERMPHPANSESYAGIVMNKATRRGLLEFGEELLRTREDTTHTPDELLAKLGDRFARIEVAPDDEPEPELIRPWPAEADPAAFHGVAGEIVRLIAPHSETDPHAILGQLLVAWANLIGRRPHWKVERTIHHLNLFVCLVGMSSKARKGTSWDHVRWLMHACDPSWVDNRILSGMASGEGFIWNVRDPIVLRVKQKSGPFKGTYEEVEIDPGERDKRALWVESEFGSTLSVMSRDGNSLSGNVRKAWDWGDLRSATKNSPLRATGAHSSLIGHVTDDELRLRLTRSDERNGFGNRFLWLCAKRSRFLPHGGRIQDVVFTEVVRDLRHATENSRLCVYDDPIERDLEADELWESVYEDLSSAKPGLFGALTSRAEAQTMRLACIYALLDRSTTVERVHLEAALAFWRYCERSAAYIFGDSLGDPDAEKLLRAIVAAGDAGLTLTDMRRKVFRGHKTAAQTSVILDVIARAGLAEQVTRGIPEGGGPIIVSWKSTAPGKMS